jgi:low affinity Fe/Cu permease
MNDWFCTVSRKTSDTVGSPYAFLTALSIVVSWFVVSSVFFRFNSMSQLFINTFTTIITFLMVFLIQAAQDADTKSLHAKLDELIIAVENADNELVEIEHKGADALQHVQQKHERVQ